MLRSWIAILVYLVGMVIYLLGMKTGHFWPVPGKLEPHIPKVIFGSLQLWLTINILISIFVIVKGKADDYQIEPTLICVFCLLFMQFLMVLNNLMLITNVYFLAGCFVAASLLAIFFIFNHLSQYHNGRNNSRI